MLEDRNSRRVGLVVLVAALGYFVDIYDLILFAVVRVASLKDLGVTDPEAITTTGKMLIDTQMYGMLIGGILWGVLGDKRGRLSVLFGTILMYSLANLLNAHVHSIEMYRLLRFIAGVGLAGELGAGVTLVAELMSKETRGYGTTLVAFVGVFGAVVASLVGGGDWRRAYTIGGVLGLALLALRFGTFESGMFEKAKSEGVKRGSIGLLFWPPARLLRYLGVVFIGVPTWYVIGILVLFAPEIGKALGMDPTPKSSDAVLWSYTGLAIGGILSGFLSQIFGARKRVVLLFLALHVPAVALYFLYGPRSLFAFNVSCFVIGIAGGYWSVFVTLAAEQFGTNIRATVATTAPNFVRGTVPLLTALLTMWKGEHGYDGAALRVGVVAVAIALLALVPVEETHGKSLDYTE